jgi:ribosomal protein S19
MSRSVKKGPYVQARLLKRVEALNAENKKPFLKHGQEHLQFSHKW